MKRIAFFLLLVVFIFSCSKIPFLGSKVTSEKIVKWKNEKNEKELVHVLSNPKVAHNLKEEAILALADFNDARLNNIIVSSVYFMNSYGKKKMLLSKIAHKKGAVIEKLLVNYVDDKKLGKDFLKTLSAVVDKNRMIFAKNDKKAEMQFKAGEKLFFVNKKQALLAYMKASYNKKFSADAYYKMAKITASFSLTDIAFNYLKKAVAQKPNLIKVARKDAAFATLKKEKRFSYIVPKINYYVAKSGLYSMAGTKFEDFPGFADSAPVAVSEDLDYAIFSPNKIDWIVMTLNKNGQFVKNISAIKKRGSFSIPIKNKKVKFVRLKRLPFYAFLKYPDLKYDALKKMWSYNEVVLNYKKADIGMLPVKGTFFIKSKNDRRIVYGNGKHNLYLIYFPVSFEKEGYIYKGVFVFRKL